MMAFLKNRWLWLALDVIWLVGLSLYVGAGTDNVPFHGDESSLIYMSRDYHYLVQQRDLDRVLYTESPENPSEQELRLLNGTVGKMAMGLAWDLGGYTVEDLNEPWAWGLGWDLNAAMLHVPSDDVLYAARLSSAVLTIISVWAVFAITLAAFPNHLAAWAASLIYATTPALLLNGRRAMMEGSLLAFSALTMLAALLVIREQARDPRPRRGVLLAWTAAWAVAGGFAIASKHTAVMTVAVTFAIIALEPAIRKRRWEWPNWRRLARWTGAGLLVILTFLALTPAWWSDLVGMPDRVLTMRQNMLDAQVEKYGGYETLDDRLTGLFEGMFSAEPQYYEDRMWDEFPVIQDEIAAYEATLLDGRGGGPVWGALLLIAFAAGLVALGYRWRAGPAWAVLAWTVVTVLGLLALTPFDWQRYYLPLQAPVAVVAGIGAVRFVWYVLTALLPVTPEA